MALSQEKIEDFFRGYVDYKGKVTEDLQLADLGISDSLDYADLVLEIEEFFGVSVPDEKMDAGIKTVGDLIKLIESVE